MDKKTMKQYRSLKRELKMLDKKSDKLYEQLENVPAVKGRVMKSSDEFPYIEEHVMVDVPEPRKAREIRKKIWIIEVRKRHVKRDMEKIEKFVEGIPKSLDRQVFELSFIGDKKMSQSKIGEIVGYTQGRISQIISDYLKD